MSKIYLVKHPWTSDEYFDDSISATKAFDWLGVNDPKPTITEMEKTDYILRDVPPEFKSALSYSAYERGHSAGEEEVELILEGLVSDILPSIRAFEARIKATIE